MTKDKEYLEECLRMARENVQDNLGGPFAALIVRNGEIIGRGVNRVTKNHDPSAHAEVNAIRDACSRIKDYNLSGCTIYSSCEPCPMCLGAVYWARLDRLVFASDRFDAADAGFDDELIYKEMNLPIEERRLKSEQLLKDEAKKVFEEWEISEFKKRY